MAFYVYLLECSDNSFYCGYTSDLDARLETHNKGLGGKYTRARRPVRLVYFEEFKTKSDAMKREYSLKQLNRKEKEEIIFAKRLFK